VRTNILATTMAAAASIRETSSISATQQCRADYFHVHAFAVPGLI
jgi:hypothetical protein